MADGFVSLEEVGIVLSAHPKVRCIVDEETEGDDLVVTLVVKRASFEPLAVQHELEHLRDVGQVRHFAAQYGVPP